MPRAPIVLLALALLAGCVDAAEEPVEAAAAPPAAAPAPPETAPIHFSGNLGLGAYACAAVLCDGATVVGGERFFEVAAGPATMSLDVVADWPTTAPTDEAMLVGVLVCDPDDCQGDDDASFFDYASGSAPLAFSVQRVEVPEGQRLFLWANAAATSAGPVGIQPATPREFVLDGLLTLER